MANDKPKKTVTIIIEGTEHDWPKGDTSFTEVVTLEVPDYAQHPEITYSVRYKRGQGNKPEGTLAPGASVKVKEGTIFSVSETGRRNPDLGRLVERGYAVAFDSNCLVVRDIPYLDQHSALLSGVIVAKLVFVDQEHVQQDDHQIYFAGSHPHQIDGSPILNLGGGETTIQLSEACADVVVQRSFSNKPMPEGRFPDFYAKIESYVSIISGPAIERHLTATPFTYRVDEIFEPDPIFKLQDTLTSHARIGDLNAGFADETATVIGLGGTGAYLLDLLVKAPVPKIRAFDGDTYHVHTAFRSPGRYTTDKGEGDAVEAVGGGFVDVNGLDGHDPTSSDWARGAGLNSAVRTESVWDVARSAAVRTACMATRFGNTSRSRAAA